MWIRIYLNPFVRHYWILVALGRKNKIRSEKSKTHLLCLLFLLSYFKILTSPF